MVETVYLYQKVVLSCDEMTLHHFRNLLENAFKVSGLSMRGYNSLMTVTRTIADLDGAKNINVTHLSEAISYRRLENKYWNR